MVAHSGDVGVHPSGPSSVTAISCSSLAGSSSFRSVVTLASSTSALTVDMSPAAAWWSWEGWYLPMFGWDYSSYSSTDCGSLAC